MKFNKKSQSEVITTVLLILISIAAVVLVSSFILNMVKNNLKGTECFQTMGQIEIKMDGGNSWFNYTSKNLTISISRGSKEFNLSKIIIVYGNEFKNNQVEIKTGGSYNDVYYNNFSGDWDNNNLALPEASGLMTYIVSKVPINVTSVSIVPTVAGGSQCEKVDEKDIPSYP